MRLRSLLQDLKWIGQAKGDKRIYSVVQGTSDYLVVSPNGRTNLNVTIVDKRAPEALTRRFHGREVTTSLLKRRSRRADLLGGPFAPLNALYVMVALGRARKLKKREGKAMVFKIL